MPSSRRPSKRSLLSADASPLAKRIQTRSSRQIPLDDDPLTLIDSDILSPLSSAKRVPAGPANPGIIRNRDQGPLSRLPADSDALETFTSLRIDDKLSDEEAFLKFITTYDVPLSTLHQISAVRLPMSFSNVKYTEIAAYTWLDPSAQGRDIRKLKAFRSRIPIDVFRKIYADVDKATLQYGRMESHDNEEARSRFITSFFSEIVCLFGSTVINKPEGLLDSEFTKKGRIEHHFYAMSSVSIVFFEVKKTYTVGVGRLDVIAQVLAECAACDYANSKYRHWVPILAILCDGEKFDFFVYDSGSKYVYSSGMITGVVDMEGEPDLLVSSLKKTAEYIFDYFLMAYINGLRSFGHKSELTAARSRSKKRESSDRWMEALAKAERAHLLCREAAALAQRTMLEKAEENATRGINELKESVLLVPGMTAEGMWDSWNEEVALKA